MKSVLETIVAKVKSEPAVIIGALVSLVLIGIQVYSGSVTLVVALPLISGIVTRFFVSPAQAQKAEDVLTAAEAQVKALMDDAQPFLGDNPDLAKVEEYYAEIVKYADLLKVNPSDVTAPPA